MIKCILLILFFYSFHNGAEQQICHQTASAFFVKNTLHTRLDSIPPGQTQSPQNQLAEEALIEISGLIIDDTRTKAGRDFYDLFYTQWQPPEDYNSYTITIKEIPAFGRNSSVTIELNDELIAQRFLQPRTDIIEEQVDITIQILNAIISGQGDLNSQLDNEDTKGTGIY